MRIMPPRLQLHCSGFPYSAIASASASLSVKMHVSSTRTASVVLLLVLQLSVRCYSQILECGNIMQLELMQLHLQGRQASPHIYPTEWVAVNGCFNPSNGTVSTAPIAVLIMQNGLTIAQSIMENSGCFEIEFALSEPGDHKMELVASLLSEVENTSVLCNGSIPLQLEVLERESCYRIAVLDSGFCHVGSLYIAKENNSTLWIRLQAPDISAISEEHLSFKYASLGANPTVTLTNSTTKTNARVEWAQEYMAWSVTLEAEMLMDTSNGFSIDVEMQVNIEQCTVQSWHGTVLLESKVPILQWMSSLSPSSEHHTTNSGGVLVHHLQCHPEIAVALRGLDLTITEDNFKSYVNVSFHICDLAALSESQCSSMTIIDVMLTYTHLLIITSSGLLVSGNPMDYPPLHFVTTLPFLIEEAHFVKQGTLLCQYPIFSAERVLVEIPPCANEASQGPGMVLYTATPPFQAWESWNVPVNTTVGECGSGLKVAIDVQREVYVAAIFNDTDSTVYAVDRTGQVVLSAGIQESKPTGAHYHAPTATIYVFGSEIWLSADGGYTFHRLLSMPVGESVVDFDFSDRGIAVLTSSGRVFYGKVNSWQIEELGAVLLPTNTTKLVFDSSGALGAYTFHSQAPPHRSKRQKLGSRPGNEATRGNQSFKGIFYYLQDYVENIPIPALSLLIKQQDDSCYLMSQMVDAHLVYLYSIDNSSCLAEKASLGWTVTGSSGEGLVVDIAPDNYGILVTTFQTGLTGLSEFTFSSGRCWLYLKRKGPGKQIYELDVDDPLELQVELMLVDPEVSKQRLDTFPASRLGKGLSTPECTSSCKWTLAGNPKLFDFHTTTVHHPVKSTLTLYIRQKNTVFNSSMSTVTFQCAHCSSRCRDSMLTVIISSKCPSPKKLTFIYPQLQEQEEQFELPVNYRPPSWLGSAIPMSPHVYNADPALPLKNTHYAISKNAEFKQCFNRSTRSECNCSTAVMEISFSDCIKKVYRHPFQEPFRLKFVVQLDNGAVVPVQQPITIDELNNRTDVLITGQVDDKVVLPFNPTDLVFQGPGLYHFRATVTTNSSFCHLRTEFVVYVDRVPLVEAAEHSLTISTTVIFGIVTLVAYIFYHNLQTNRLV